MTTELKLQVDKPLEVSFRNPIGKVFQTTYGPRRLFELSDGRSLWLSEKEGSRITDMAPGPDELLRICRRSKRANGKTWTEFYVESAAVPARVETTPNGHGALAVPAAPQVPPTAAPHPASHSGSSQALLQTSQVLVDLMAATLRYAQDKYGDTITRDDVRALVLNAYARGVQL